MRAVEFQEYGGPEVLRPVTAEAPQPADELVVGAG